MARFPAQNKTVIDTESATAQDKVYVTRTTGFTAGSTVQIAYGTDLEESGVIESITDDDYLVLTENLVNTHAIGTYVYQETDKMVYESDEPNFPGLYHELLIYRTMVNLCLNQPENLQIWTARFKDRLTGVTRDTRGSEENTPRFVIS